MSGNDYGNHVGSRGTTLITTAAAFGLMHTGFENTVASSVSFHLYDSDSRNTRTSASWLQQSDIYGALFALILTFLFGDKLGRKKSFLLGLGLAVIGAVVETASFGYVQSVAGRVLIGLAQGFELVAAPTWVAEAASPKSRGGLVVLLFLASQFGGCFANWIMYGFVQIAGTEAGWRAPLGLQFLFLVPAVVAGVLAPESPKVEDLRGHSGKGRRGQSQVVGPYGEIMSGDRQGVDTSEICYEVGVDKAPRRFWRLFLGVAVQCMAPLTGQLLTSVIFWAGYRYYSFNVVDIMSTMIGVTTLLALVLAFGLVDTVGRRALLLGGALGQTICWAVLLAVGYLQQRYHGIGTGYIYYYGNSAVLTHVGLAFVYLWTICFGLGFQAVAPLYATEINTLSLRTKGLACSWFLKFGFQIMNAYTYGLGLIHLEWRYLIVWLALNLFFAIVIWLLYPETSRRSLEGLDTQFVQYHGLIAGTKRGATSARHRGRDDENGDNVRLTQRSPS